eukprot:176700_1
MRQTSHTKTIIRILIPLILFPIIFVVVIIIIIKSLWTIDPYQNFITSQITTNLHEKNGTIKLNHKKINKYKRNVSRSIWMKKLRSMKYNPNLDNNMLIKMENWNISKLKSIGITVDTMKKICHKTYFNTIQTTVNVLRNEGTVFVITGDIHAMWIRDSTEQIIQYAPLMNSPIDSVRFKIKYLFQGLILKQAQYIIHDPYANSYDKTPHCYNYRIQLLTNKTNRPYGFVATRDYELDNGGYFIKLLYIAFRYEMYDIFSENIVIKCINVLFKLWEIEQNHNELSDYKPHIIDIERARYNEQLNISDYIGMIYTSRRPSDNRVMYGYHIPDNLFIHHSLKYLIEINNKIWKNHTMEYKSLKLRDDIWKSIHKYGIYNHTDFGLIYCYEIDGFGNCNLMDDANIPGLLSIPYFTDYDDENGYDKYIFNNTIRFILSKNDPYYYQGKYAKGIGSSHTPTNMVWPIGLVSFGLLNHLNINKYDILGMIVNNTGNTLYMHESFHVNDPNRYTRGWFAWANSYFSTFGNCLNQFVEKDNIEMIVNEAIKLENVTYTDIKVLKDDDYNFNSQRCMDRLSRFTGQ